MGALSTRGLWFAFVCVLAFAAMSAHADEIRLKDGKKLYGVIVAYEENMFKVKTDFGFVLVEKDKIASIIPAVPTSSEAPAAKAPANAQPKSESAVAKPADGSSPTNASEKSVITSAGKQSKNDKSGKIGATSVKPELPANAATAVAVTPPALKGSAVA